MSWLQMSKRVLLAAVFVGCALAVGAAGCANINVKVGEGGGDSRKAREIDKGEAVKIARHAAEREGLNPDKFDIAASKSGKAWWVNFDEKHPGSIQGWAAHFSVRVDQDGTPRLFK